MKRAVATATALFLPPCHFDQTECVEKSKCLKKHNMHRSLGKLEMTGVVALLLMLPPQG